MFPKYTEECPAGMLEIITTVKPEQADESGRIRLGDLARQMQTLTEKHFDAYMGITIRELNEKNLSWIIAWSELQILRLPNVGEKIRMRVWAGKKKSVMHTRKYAFYTMDGEPLVTTSSLFILMDRQSRQAASDPEEMKRDTVLTLADEPKPPKMMLQFPEEYAERAERIVSADEIDYNGHLNNSHYLDWSECLPGETYLRNHIPRTVWIEYSKEMTQGQSAGLNYELRNDILYVQGMCEGTQSYRMKAEYDIA